MANLKKRQKRLEKLLLEPSSITLKDRVTNLSKNLKKRFWTDTTGKIYTAFLAAGITLTAYCAYGIVTWPHRTLQTD